MSELIILPKDYCVQVMGKTLELFNDRGMRISTATIHAENDRERWIALWEKSLK